MGVCGSMLCDAAGLSYHLRSPPKWHAFRLIYTNCKHRQGRQLATCSINNRTFPPSITLGYSHRHHHHMLCSCSRPTTLNQNKPMPGRHHALTVHPCRISHPYASGWRLTVLGINRGRKTVPKDRKTRPNSLLRHAKPFWLWLYSKYKQRRKVP